MPVTNVRSKWSSGSLVFEDTSGNELMTIATTGVNIPTFTIDSLTLDAGATVDLNGIADAFVLDADADTTISAPTDDQIDIEISGADDFTFTANSFNVLSGSNIDLADSCAVTFGDGDDASISFDGTDTIFDNTGTLQIQWAGVGGLEIDDSAITSFAAAADTAGKGIFVETQDGGTDTAVDGGNAGGALSIKTGDGGTAGADQNGGAGGDVTLTGGTGSAGGAHTANDPNGGDGGDVVLIPGSGGAAGAGGSGTAGVDGAVFVNGGKSVLQLGAQVAPGTTVGDNYLTMKSNGTAPTGTGANVGHLYADFETDDDELFWLSGTGGTATQLTT